MKVSGRMMNNKKRDIFIFGDIIKLLYKKICLKFKNSYFKYDKLL